MEEEWRPNGATLSDKAARKEFGLTQDEIEAAIDAGQLQYRVGVIHGNPRLRLLRRELEDLMESTYNDRVVTAVGHSGSLQSGVRDRSARSSPTR
ncbi:MAG: hypothetical protein LC799_27015 [Actinobacteria bacterium]|nr:hypothetical protein [Actinomycetota bacterium]